VVVGIIAVLVTVAIDRLLQIRMEAERASVAPTVGALRAALGIEMARRVLREGVGSVAQLEGENPMLLLAQQPPNYRGEVEDIVNQDIGPGDWYFDKGTKTLKYLVQFTERFQSDSTEPNVAAYKVILRFQDINRNGRYDSATDAIQGLDIEPSGDFKW